MHVISIFIAILAVTRLAVAQSQTGYNYPSPFNPLTSPGSSGDIGGSSVPSAQQPSSSFAGSQTNYNNQQFSPSAPQGPPSYNAVPTLTPGFNQQPQFGQPSAGSLPAVGIIANVPAVQPTAGSFVPSSPAANVGYPAASATPSKGFDGNFPHSGSSHSSGAGHSVGGSHTAGGSHSTGGSHSSSGHPGFGSTSPTFPSSASGFPGSAGDIGSAGFGASSFGNQGAPGQSSFGNQPTNFGGQNSGSSQTSGSGQFDDGSYNGGDYSAIPGTPGVDYPIYTEIPNTSFDCKNQQFPGYYADVEAQCQVFHICALNTTFNFLCPNGTIFSQESLVCVWWNQFDCQTAPSLYGNNAYIYDYSKTGQQSDSSNAGFGGQGQIPSNSFDGGFGSSAPGTGFGAQPGSQGFAQPPSVSGFSPSQPSQPSAPGFSSAQPNVPGFAGSQPPSASGFGSPVGSAVGYPSSSSAASAGVYPSSSSAGSVGGYPASPSSGSVTPGFVQTSSHPSSHSTGFGQSHLPSGGGSSHTSHNIPSSYPSQSGSGAEQYPSAAVPPSGQSDYQPSAIPTIPSSISSSAAPFGGAATVTGYPPAGTPTPINTPINTPLSGEQPSREYLPSRRTK